MSLHIFLFSCQLLLNFFKIDNLAGFSLGHGYGLFHYLMKFLSFSLMFLKHIILNSFSLCLILHKFPIPKAVKFCHFFQMCSLNLLSLTFKSLSHF